ncbi:ribosome recycling factor [Gammaproteobacteria bacterium]|nr:ribosome recycling factor [Gammaproteobacteria bacterium]
MINNIKKDSDTRMSKSIESLRQDLVKLRTGRASTSLLDHIEVLNYGVLVPLSQVANINVVDSRTIGVTPWEKNMVGPIEKAIMQSDLGLNPATNGMMIRVPLPPLTEDRRKDMVKIVRSEGEAAKVSVRNIRRDANTKFKDLLKDKSISEDDAKRAEDDTQKLTDKAIAEIDKILSNKEAEVMEV